MAQQYQYAKNQCVTPYIKHIKKKTLHCHPSHKPTPISNLHLIKSHHNVQYHTFES